MCISFAVCIILSTGDTMLMDYKLIGSRIQARRKAQKKTQENMAEALLVTVGYISQIERGITKINLDTLAQVADYLSCDVADLVAGASSQTAAYLEPELSGMVRELSPKQRKLLFDLISVIKDNDKGK